MEDALAQKYIDYVIYYKKCLNPCFNGRCTRTLGIVAVPIGIYLS